MLPLCFKAAIVQILNKTSTKSLLAAMLLDAKAMSLFHDVPFFFVAQTTPGRRCQNAAQLKSVQLREDEQDRREDGPRWFQPVNDPLTWREDSSKKGIVGKEISLLKVFLLTCYCSHSLKQKSL